MFLCYVLKIPHSVCARQQTIFEFDAPEVVGRPVSAGESREAIAGRVGRKQNA